MDLSCPKCESENTQKLSLLVQAATISTTSNGLGAVSAGDGLAIGFASSTGTSISDLAEIHAAPERSSVFWAPVIVVGLGLIASTIVGPWATRVAAALALWLVMSAVYDNIIVFPDALHSWSKGFICLRCSNVFKETKTNDSSASLVPANSLKG